MAKENGYVAVMEGEREMPKVFFKDLLRDAMTRADITPTELARRLKVSRQIIYKWLSGNVLPSYRHSRALEQVLGIPAYPVSNVLRTPPHAGMRIPLLQGEIANAGTGAVTVDSTNPEHIEEWIDIDFQVSEGTVALRIRGDSMHPRFAEGEIIVVDPGIAVVSGDFVIAEVEDDKHHRLWTFKQYRPRGEYEGVVFFDLVPINPRYKTITVGESVKGRIIGALVEHRMRPQLHPKSG